MQDAFYFLNKGDDIMNPCEITALVTAFSNILAQNLTENELNLISAIFSQIGDTLDTIAAQKALCSSNK